MAGGLRRLGGRLVAEALPDETEEAHQHDVDLIVFGQGEVGVVGQVGPRADELERGVGQRRESVGGSLGPDGRPTGAGEAQLVRTATVEVRIGQDLDRGHVEGFLGRATSADLVDQRVDTHAGPL